MIFSRIQVVSNYKFQATSNVCAYCLVMRKCTTRLTQLQHDALVVGANSVIENTTPTY